MDRYALRVLFRMAGGEEWREKLNWNTDAELSTWHGVTVNDQGRVVKLDLGNNNLRGTIPRELGKLTALIELYLNDNGLTGSIPMVLGALTELTYLNLDGNELTGGPAVGESVESWRTRLERSRTAIAKYKYVAKEPEQLSFEAGDIVLLYTHKVNAKGWGLGLVNGKVGWFPGGFVEMLPERKNRPNKVPPQSTSSPSPSADTLPPTLPDNASETVGGVNGGQRGILGMPSGVEEEGGRRGLQASVDDRGMATRRKSPHRGEHVDGSRTVNTKGRVSGGSAGIPENASPLSGGGGGGRGSSWVDSILEAAQRASEAAMSSSISGVPEVGMLVGKLATLLADNKGNRAAFRNTHQLCKSLTDVLNNAENTFLRKGTRSDAGRDLLERVQERVRALVDVMEAYMRKSKLGRAWNASLYRRRVEEAEVAVRQMLEYLNTYIQGECLRETSDIKKAVAQLAVAQLADPSLRRRKRVEDLIEETEIDKDSIEIDKDIQIGSGGSSTVYLADYGGVNAACKVTTIKGCDRSAAEQQRKSFLLEVRNMRRLNNSPRVVRVFGILTSGPSELILVMEYMPGGDLFSFIRKHREQDLPEFPDKLTRSLVEDTAKGLAHLHKHDTWHGDLKSINILLTSDNRAKISDFGTSHWTAQTTSNCLLTQTPGMWGFNRLSLHWAAPEVLEQGNPSEQPGLSSPSAVADLCRLSFKSDVYSFGVVLWEVLSREVPWANVSCVEMYQRVCVHDLMLTIPSSAPADLADLARECWQKEPETRPTCDEILARLHVGRATTT
ncbi:unnamed protein product [Pylaiella littoralis]